MQIKDQKVASQMTDFNTKLMEVFVNSQIKQEYGEFST
jgi:hypothetical protein